MKTTTTFRTFPVQTCFIVKTDNGKGKLVNTVDHVMAWTYTPTAETDPDHDSRYLWAILADVRRIAADTYPNAETRTYFDIDPMNPDHADLIAAWREMEWASWYDWAMANDYRAETARKLDAESREDMKSEAVVSFYTDNHADMYAAHKNAQNALDRYIRKTRQSADPEYNPNWAKCNLPRPETALNTTPRKTPVDLAVDLAIEAMDDETLQAVILYMMDGVSVRDMMDHFGLAKSTMERKRNRAIIDFMCRLSLDDSFIFILDRLGISADEYAALIDDRAEKARKAKGKK